jgi:tRNA (cmo5U34)-methyltransferase
MMDRPHFEDPEFVKRYAEGPGRFLPGYAVMQTMSAQLIAERIGEEGRVLILGAGGGLEIEAFARLHPAWRFVGVDPAKEMLSAARKRAAVCGAQAEWHEGYIFDAPAGPFDAATSMLTLHFVADDGGKFATLRAIRDRLKPNAPFILVDLCIDKSASDHALHVERYRRWALNSGADTEDVAATVERVKHLINTVAPARDEALLVEAGFSRTQLFYAGLSWRGWVAYA